MVTLRGSAAVAAATGSSDATSTTGDQGRSQPHPDRLGRDRRVLHHDPCAIVWAASIRRSTGSLNPSERSLLSSPGDHDGPVDAPRDGRDPARGRDVVPRLGAARGGRLRDRAPSTTGPSDRTALARDGDGTSGTWSADVAGVAPGRRVPVHDPDRRRRPVADRPVRPRRSRARSATASCTTRPPSTGATTRSRCRPGTTSSSTRCTSARSAASADRRGTFDSARRRLRYLEHLGVSAVQVMPPFEFAGDISWGYNPAHLFAIESGYGGPDAFKGFIREAHSRGIAVIVDVVYNHLGPSDLDLWRFDGWAEGDGGGHLLLQRRAWRDAVGRDAPGLRPRRGPDVPARQRDDLARGVPLRRPAVRFDRLHPDGRRRTRRRPGRSRCPTAGRSWPGSPTRSARRQPWKITIAEDLEDDPIMTTPTADGGAGFGAQWDAGFIRRVRPQLVVSDDADRDMAAVVGGIVGEGRGDPTEPGHLHRVARRGGQRPGPRPRGDRPGDAGSWCREEAGGARLGARPHLARASRCCSRARSCSRTAGSTTRSRSTGRRRATNRGILRLHRDLIALRRARRRRDRAACAGPNVAILRADQEAKVLAMHRWMDGGPHDDTVVVANFADRTDRRPAGSGSRRPAAGTCGSTRTRRATPTTSAATTRSTSTPTASRSTAASRAGSSRSGRTAW